MADLYLDETSRGLSLRKLKNLFVSAGCTHLYVKQLAANDNSKNQIYVGDSAEDTRPLPTGTWISVPGSSLKGARATSRNILQAPVDLHWLRIDGGKSRATDTKLIMYPQYGQAGEFRLSGFLRGVADRPSTLLNSDRRGREPGRMMFFGTSDSGRVLCFVGARGSRVSRELSSERVVERVGVFDELRLPLARSRSATSAELLRALGDVHRRGWVTSKILTVKSGIRVCTGPQSIGQTLLAELGVPADGRATPDFRGWEIKAYTVKTLHSTASRKVTLMTPQPSGGYYAEYGIAAFLARYGSRSSHDPAKIYFEGQHRLGIRNSKRGTTLMLSGYDPVAGKIIDASGGVSLVDDNGAVAASWGFAQLVEHWRKKHARAVFVPAIARMATSKEFKYASHIHLATGNPFALLMNAFLSGAIIYDPGIRIDESAGAVPSKPRSQFRIAIPRYLTALYQRVALRQVL